ncbi:MAG TPA: hypothetical protein VKG63_16235 [Steroidobacteraceae bacterium]|nr:hypothetical protein [Steroidobacteraceae bacterium]
MAARWAHRSVEVMTPQDLCVSGWRQHLGACESDTSSSDVAVVQRRLLPQREITGVLTRLPWVTDGEVIEVAAHDRGYVATEMTAFLLFWLSRLKCPVLNRPTPTCLSGPYWRAEKWVHVAARAGIPVQAARRDTQSESAANALPPTTSVAVTVIGRHIFGDAHPELLAQSRRLSELAEVALLTVRFADAERGAAFLGADTFSSLDDERFKEAALEYLCKTPAANQ